MLVDTRKTDHVFPSIKDFASEAPITSTRSLMPAICTTMSSNLHSYLERAAAMKNLHLLPKSLLHLSLAAPTIFFHTTQTPSPSA
jgi:hypothetical protein